MKYAYLFEARGIQRFLFGTGKLKDMVQGSELIDYICADGGYLDKVLKGLNLADSVKSPRRAGGAFYLVFNHKNDRNRFCATWRLAAAKWLPTIEKVDASSEGDTVQQAIKQGIDLLAKNRNKINVELPIASPITERSPRTGLAAVNRSRQGSGQAESIDIATATVRKFKGISLTEKFIPSDNMIIFPTNFEKEAGDSQFVLGKRNLIGLIHADGNGLGEVLRLLNDACADATDEIYLDLYKTFSDGLTEATVIASKKATEQIILSHAQNKVIPTRPLVLGGDDLSVIVRADLAIPFTEVFLKYFKEESGRQMTILANKFNKHNLQEKTKNLPKNLTACAGIVFMKASQPFYGAYSLAEALCNRAKKYSRQLREEKITDEIASSVAFFKVNQSMMESIEALNDTQIAQHADAVYHLSLPAYLVDNQQLTHNMQSKAQQIYHLEDLLNLEKFIKNSTLNDNALREIATLIHVNLPQAKQVYRRWTEFTVKQQNNSNAERLKAQGYVALSEKQKREKLDIETFERQLTEILGSLENDLPFSKPNVQTNDHFSILSDLLALFTVNEEKIVTPLQARRRKTVELQG